MQENKIKGDMTDDEKFDAEVKASRAGFVLRRAIKKLNTAHQTGIPAYLTDEEAEAAGVVDEPAFAGADLVEVAVVHILSRSFDGENDPRNYPEYYAENFGGSDERC